MPFASLRVLVLPAVVMLGAAAAQRIDGALLRHLTVGTSRISFETPDGKAARFRFVDQALGRARRPSSSTDGLPTSACYRPLPDPSAGEMTLLFESDEMGDAEALTEFELIPRGSRPEVERGCRRLAVPSASIVTDRGIRLGLTRAAVVTLLGAPVRDHDDVAEFERVTERTVRVGGTVDRYDVFSAITVTFRDGRVVAFSGALGDTD